MIELPLGVDINNLIDDLRIFSWEAADIMLHYSNLIKKTDLKKNIIKTSNFDDPVTLADLKVNELMIERINNKYKHINWEILSEENVKIKSKKYEINSDWLWVLDPLDGTKDFIQGSENYAMHLALNYKNRPQLGIVLIPEKDELWISNGSEVWGERRDRSKLNFEISSYKPLSEMILVTSKNHRNLILQNLIEKISFKKVIVMGSIGCKIAAVVKGQCDIYICLSVQGKSSPKDWDFAAPEAILKGSGGAITNLDNAELSYNQNNFQQGGIIIATRNKDTHQDICSQIKEIIKKYDLYPLKS
ncbi:3'(2'),5'-bisphosphate nucleotidase CysQ [Prochlorococcus marinus]|uniref:3'(2'),5'-bisphosphate nucleotidase CysQ n=1 Tax=Prochlorococcus marinus TaxID=1219 RepID=UPI001ADC6680|nr:3'(2'),5'-bisphosphate nucleotidase CysQ [Prochlorococcus marinus]MBO8217645.1 3'(2'),5'-bisphosphate nucleotidase CysQ [Prochlorococcus marinus XMU1405]MBW3040807.1 3'(2'),5'-bisphosphate nucleotidase CysQ [Prochlorococcus marinus str. MU1405]MBW3048266.1 3'(2'),5'-bisphosphate nucleotidase CysQ [Prochlorococcus marinus str. MU1406]